jgi:tetratricopeptide (TPR) repeat protein
VIGTDVPLAVLESVDVEAAHGLHQSLSELQAAEFLYQTQLFPEAEYTFKHALTHEVAYGSLVQERRHALHRAVLAAIERLCEGRLDEHLERLALHAVRSESWDKAVAYSAEAAARAKRRWALRGALASLEQALAALAQLPRTRENLQRAVDLHIEARTCLVLLGDIAPMLGHLDRAGLAAEALEGDAQRARVAGHRAHTHWGILCARQGDFRGAIPLLEEGLQFSRTLGFQAFVPTIGNLLAEAQAQVGRFAEAQALLDEVPTLSRGSAHTSWALALLLLGRLADARGLVVEAAPGTRECGERGAEAWLLWLLGEIAVRESPSESHATAIRFREALALAEPRGMRPLVAHCHLGLGKFSQRTGKRQEAHEHLTTATTMYREMDMRFYLEQAEAAMRQGN